MSQDFVLSLEGLILSLHGSGRPRSLQAKNNSKKHNPRLVGRRGGAANVS